MPSIRKAAVSGQFYPGDPEQLKHTVTELISNSANKNINPLQPKALIVPHAGYIYSGAAAAEAFSRLIPFKDQIERVILLGPSHHVAFNGLATSKADFFETPLGQIPLDKESTVEILKLPQVNLNDDAHRFEHSLEVELPFLQTVLSRFILLPLVVGDANSKAVSSVLETLWGNAETLVVISSDLSHFLDYETANKRDKRTCLAIEGKMEKMINDHDACGRNPIKGLLVSSKTHALDIETVALCNSGDTAGDKSRVVGYGSWVLT